MVLAADPAPVTQAVFVRPVGRAVLGHAFREPFGLAARLDEIQTLPRKTPVLGDDFVRLIRQQIGTWSAVAKKAKVEVIV